MYGPTQGLTKIVQPCTLAPVQTPLYTNDVCTYVIVQRCRQQLLIDVLLKQTQAGTN